MCSSLDNYLNGAVIFSCLTSSGRRRLRRCISNVSIFVFSTGNRILVRGRRLRERQLLSPLRIALPRKSCGIITMNGTLARAVVNGRSDCGNSSISHPRLVRGSKQTSNAFSELCLKRATVASGIVGRSHSMIHLCSRRIGVRTMILSSSSGGSRA